MLEIYGTIVGYNLAVKGKFDENCAATCFLKPDCVVAVYDINSMCVAIPYRNLEKMIITRTKPEDGLFAAFKTNLSTSNPDFCPIQSKIAPTIFLGRDPISWRKTSDTTWEFNKCFKDFKMFKRTNPDVSVCMLTQGAYGAKTQEDILYSCWTYNLHVIGIGSLEEAEWVAGHFGENAGVWINGVNSTPDFRASDTSVREFIKTYGRSEYVKSLLPKTELV
ncbi:unnamed protein product [Caenorhabditis nigoni]